MANTYTQCFFHLVYAVRNREALIGKSWKNELEMYITGLVQNQHHKMLAAGTMPDALFYKYRAALPLNNYEL